MEKDLCTAFDAFLSPNDEARVEAERFIINMVHENPELYIALFDIYYNSSIDIHKKLSLIIVNYIIRTNFEAISPNLPIFSQNLRLLIIDSDNQDFYRHQSEIVIRIAFAKDDFWEDFPTYLTLYQEYPKLQSFCVFLYVVCCNIERISLQYGPLFNELDHEITLIGLQEHQDPDIKINTIAHITKKISKCNDDTVLQQYQEQSDLICQIAAESADNMDILHFERLWSQFYRLQPRYLDQLFDIALKLLETKELGPSCQMKLLNILISDYLKLTPENLETIINTYFTAQMSVGDIDFNDKIFINLSKVDFIQSYERFKNILLIFLTSNDEYQQYIGLHMINGFVNTYMCHINSIISDLIDFSLQIAPNSIENFQIVTNFLVNYLNFNKLSYEDTEKINNLLYELLTNSSNIDYHYLGAKISQKTGPNPVYFDRFIESFEKIQLDSLPIYFSLLLNLHSVENDMTDEKYDRFFEFLIGIFESSCQKTNELWQQNIENDENEENDEKLDECFDSVILRNTCSNLLCLFSIFNPGRFPEYFEKTIQCFIDLLEKDDMRDIYCDYFSLDDIKSDFTRIFKINTMNFVEILKNSYNVISTAIGIEEIQHILLEIDDSNYTEKDEFYEEFNCFKKEILVTKKRMPIDEIIYNTEIILLPMSMWIYKENNPEIFDQFINLVSYLFRFTKSSHELIILLTRILKRVVKPKRVMYNNENEWYSQICCKTVDNMKIFITEILPSVNIGTHCQSFEAYCNLMKFFMYSEDSFGHDFLNNIILPFYKTFCESSEIGLLNLFSKMIDINYCNEEEIAIMLQIVGAIIERESFYLDPRPALFNLITKISAITNDDTDPFFLFAVQTFTNIKDEPLLFDTKIASANFLLTMLNKNQEKFQEEIFPLLPDIFFVFPCKKFANNFFAEMQKFLNGNEESFTKELYELFIATLAKYLAYQSNPVAIFEFDPSFNVELLKMFGHLLETYFQRFQIDGGLEEFLNVLLPGHPFSIQYILSLQS